MKNIEQIATRHVEGLKVLSGLIGFDKAYGVIVASLVNDETYSWEEKRVIFRRLREGWIDSGFADDMKDFLHKRDEKPLPVVEPYLDRVQEAIKSAVSHNEYLKIEEKLSTFQGIVQHEHFKRGFADGIKLVASLI